MAATGAAFAQSSVELYGRVDFGYAAAKTTLGTGVTKLTSVAGGDSQRTSDRIGLKGTEDLGGGLKASFNYEMALAPDNTAADSIGGTREGFVALSGGFGSVKLGTMTNVFDGMVGNTHQNATGNAGGAIILFPGRTTNTIAYTSPSFSGLTLGVAAFKDKVELTNGGAYAADATAALDSKATILSASYAAGPLSVTAGYGDWTVGAASAIGLGGAVWDDAKAFGAVDGKLGVGNKVKSTAIKGSYDLGVAVPYVLFADNKVTDAASTSSAGFRATEIGVVFPMGAFTPMISMVNGKTRDDYEGIKYTGFEAGVTYALSKRTTAYLTTGSKKMKADDVEFFKKTATAIGIAHTF